jgi:hypothetical protein
MAICIWATVGALFHNEYNERGTAQQDGRVTAATDVPSPQQPQEVVGTPERATATAGAPSHNTEH